MEITEAVLFVVCFFSKCNRVFLYVDTLGLRWFQNHYVPYVCGRNSRKGKELIWCHGHMGKI